MVTLRLRSRPDQSTADHRKILEQLRAGEADAMRATFTLYRTRSVAELLAILRDNYLPPL